MIAPRCIRPGCSHVVKRRAGRHALKTVERRIVEGVEWCWYCSRSCACQVQGQRRAAVFGQHVWRLAEARRTAAAARWRAEVTADAQAIIRYGVPRAVAVATLVRLAQRFEHRGYNRAYHRFARQAS